MFRSLRFRLLISILLPVLLILPVTGLVLNYLIQTQVFVAAIANEVIGQAVLVAEAGTSSVEMWQDEAQAQAFAARVSPRLSARLMLFDPRGKLLVTSEADETYLVGQVYEMPDLQRLLAQETPVAVHYDQSQIADVVVPVVTSSGRLLGFVRLDNPLAGIYARSEGLRQVVLYVVAGGILAGLLLGWLLVRDLERPLRKTSAAVYELASGELAAQALKEEGPEEIRRLIRAFNILIERLKASEEARRKLLANTVHELGRPLGALLSAVQALRGGADEQPALRRELLSGMENEVTLLSRLLDDMTHLNQGAAQITLHKQTVHPSTWLPGALAAWGEAAHEKNVQWQIDIAPDLPPLEIDPDRISQALGNLLSNAIRYTPGGEKVRVAASQQAGELCIRVEDSGPGIAADELEMIFQPLYRGKAARRFSKGMGLGLPIARDLVEAHGGSLTVQSVPGKGSCFTMTLMFS